MTPEQRIIRNAIRQLEQLYKMQEPNKPAAAKKRHGVDVSGKYSDYGLSKKSKK